MSPEERQLLTALFDRVQTASSSPRDREAEMLIEDQTRRQPYAAYYLAQAVIVQEKGLEAASHRIQELEARLRDLETAAGNQRQGSGGFLSSIFGNGEQPRQGSGTTGPWSNERPDRIPVPNQAYRGNSGDDNTDYRAPQQRSGPWSGSQSFGSQPYAPSAGGSFLRGALGTAAGVAGGMLLANSLSSIFSNHVSGLGWGSAAEGAAAFGGAPIEETVINNYYGDDADNGDAQVSDDGNIEQADYGGDENGASDYGDDDFGGSDDSLDV
ncbi:DUF2076 domain-containing protein [Neorhizobium sp. NPDC001467]|uniref:DUF2076 domain-containing protein n=1 Tax=Neorhizobium sp. NPDC001467 TaxID=3390595 RepID=UPI003CFE7137